MTPGEKAWQHEITQRVGGQGRQRIDLIGDPHRSDLCRHRRSDSTGDHQPGDDRSKLPRYRQHDDRRDRTLGGESAETGVGLECQHHPGKDRRQPDDRQRKISDIDHFAQNRARIDRRREGGCQGQAGEHHQPPGRGKKTKEDCADRGEKRQH